MPATPTAACIAARSRLTCCAYSWCAMSNVMVPVVEDEDDKVVCAPALELAFALVLVLAVVALDLFLHSAQQAKSLLSVGDNASIISASRPVYDGSTLLGAAANSSANACRPARTSRIV